MYFSVYFNLFMYYITYIISIEFDYHPFIGYQTQF